MKLDAAAAEKFALLVGMDCIFLFSVTLGSGKRIYTFSLWESKACYFQAAKLAIWSL